MSPNWADLQLNLAVVLSALGGMIRGRVLNVLRSVEIRFARAEADDVEPVGFHLFGLGINGQSERRR